MVRNNEYRFVNYYIINIIKTVKSMTDKIYECKLCNYSTKRQDNYIRHTSSKKHKKKVAENNNKNSTTYLAPHPDLSTPQPELSTPHETTTIISSIDKQVKIKSKYVCNYCDISFKRLDNLNRHSKVCSERVVYELKKELEDKDRQFNLAIKSKERELEMLENYNDELKSDLIYYKNLIKTAGVGSGTKITNNVQSLIVNNHDDAPALEYAKPNLLKFNSKDAHENSLFLVNRYKDNTFTMFVGKCIVAACKKENPDDQSVWATDANRLTMFIKKMMDDESK